MCTYWDASQGVFSSAGCATLPSPAPLNHTVSFLDLPANVAAIHADANASAADWAARFGRAAPSGEPACKAQPDHQLAEFFDTALQANRTGQAPSVVAERQITAAWILTGPLACGCRVTVLDCAADARGADDASARARAGGGDEAAAARAAEAARQRIFPAPLDAVLVPAIRCASNDSATTMVVFYGQECAAVRNETAAAGPASAASTANSTTAAPCFWSSNRQAFLGPNCSAPAVDSAVACQCLHLCAPHAPHIQNGLSWLFFLSVVRSLAAAPNNWPGPS